MTPRQLALRFISGKYQGGEFPLGLQRRKSSSAARATSTWSWSRTWSRAATRASPAPSPQIVIEDLGSTNGTFVNGEKIARATLKEGDRVLIGTSILKVVALDPVGAHAPRAPRCRAPGAPRRRGR